MSSVSIAGDSSGSILLAAPSVAGSSTLTLPTTGGTVLSTASPQSGGVIQVVQATLTGVITVTSSTYTDTGLTATITPKFATSKILILVNHNGVRKYGSNTSVGQRILKNGSSLRNMDSIAGFTNSSADAGIGSTFQQYLDSPATTSAITYSTQINSQANSASARINDFYNDGTSSFITLMEIAA